MDIGTCKDYPVSKTEASIAYTAYCLGAVGLVRDRDGVVWFVDHGCDELKKDIQHGSWYDASWGPRFVEDDRGKLADEQEGLQFNKASRYAVKYVRNKVNDMFPYCKWEDETMVPISAVLANYRPKFR